MEILGDRERDGSGNFKSCWGVPNNMNSVFDGFKAKKFEDIQDDME